MERARWNDRTRPDSVEEASEILDMTEADQRYISSDFLVSYASIRLTLRYTHRVTQFATDRAPSSPPGR
jgi:hypothetical protein